MAKDRDRKRERQETFRETLGATAPYAEVSPQMGAMQLVSGLAGLFYLALAVSAAVPTLSTNNLVWNTFLVDGWHSVLHLAIGVIALFAAINTRVAAKVWQGLAIALGVLWLLSAFSEGQMLGFIATNAADSWLMFISAIIFAVMGWSTRQAETR